MAGEADEGRFLRPIDEIGALLDIPAEALDFYGTRKAKLSSNFLNRLDGQTDGKLILVTAMTPTRHGEGKTTTSIGLADGLSRIGERAVVCLREPSLGPVFGMKGGGTGGGKSTIEPSDDINLHFTGDLHAVTAAHNLLAAMIDNHIYWENGTGLDSRRVSWPRVLDMNDRALRQVALSLGGVSNGFAREGGFDITAASEVMAILCLTEGLDDFTERLSRIVVGRTRQRKMITAGDIDAAGAMAVLLKDAIRPNLVQTAGGTPALVHGGPFANIAHGCSSVAATRAGLKLADFVVTEAGFGADLGAEKFIDIKCRLAGLRPSAAVIVATIRALKSHGGVGLDDIENENVDAVAAGFANLGRHAENMRNFGLPVIVTLNRFAADGDAEVAKLAGLCAAEDIRFEESSHFADGGSGAESLARAVVEMAAGEPAEPNFTYDLDAPIAEKIGAIARTVYRSGGIELSSAAAARIRDLEEAGWGNVPVCIAKTQFSFSTNPKALGAPANFPFPVREIRLSAGAGFIVAVCGDMMTMPGLPREPAANGISIGSDGEIVGMS